MNLKCNFSLCFLFLLMIAPLTFSLEGEMNATVLNSPPEINLVHPSNSSNVQFRNVDLEVTIKDSNNDSVNVTFYDASNDLKLYNKFNVSDTAREKSITYTWKNLNYSETYKWYVNATDGINETKSPIWSFKIEEDEEYEKERRNGGSPPWPPRINTLNATQITNNSTTIHGKVFFLDKRHEEVKAWFEYKEKEGNWTQTQEKTIESTQKFSEKLEKLRKNTTYEFRAVIKAGGHRRKGETLQFTTLRKIPSKIPPEIILNSPEDGETKVSTSPILNVTVTNEKKNIMNVTFYDASNNKIYTEKNVSSGKNVVYVWENLEYNTTYEWYVEVTDNYNTTRSSIWRFITQEEEKEIKEDPEEVKDLFEMKLIFPILLLILVILVISYKIKTYIK